MTEEKPLDSEDGETKRLVAGSKFIYSPSSTGSCFDFDKIRNKRIHQLIQHPTSISGNLHF